MILYFLNAQGKRIKVAEAPDEQELFKRLQIELKKQKQPSHYLRYWLNDNGETMIDFGSWSEFYIISNKEDSN